MGSPCDNLVFNELYLVSWAITVEMFNSCFVAKTLRNVYTEINLPRVKVCFPSSLHKNTENDFSFIVS